MPGLDPDLVVSSASNMLANAGFAFVHVIASPAPSSQDSQPGDNPYWRPGYSWLRFKNLQINIVAT